VHASSVGDARMLNQLRAAEQRTLKADFVAGQSIRFSPSEVRELASSMQLYLRHLCAALDTNLLPNHELT
jgi:hypothetical protein